MPATQLAFDLEMVLQDSDTTPPPNQFGNPEYFELLCIGVAHRTEDSDEIHSDVLFRKGGEAEHELELISRFIDWVEMHDSPEIVFTYNGKHFDFPQLVGRTRATIMEANRGLDVLKDVKAFQKRILHEDLKEDVWACFGDYTTLEQAADRVGVSMPETRHAEYETGLTPRKWREDDERGNPCVTGADMTGYGEMFLRYHDRGMTNLRPFQELKRLIYDYSESDVPVLFRIADERPLVADSEGSRRVDTVGAGSVK